MSTSFIHFLDELEHNKNFLFLKNEKNRGQSSEIPSRWSAYIYDLKLRRISKVMKTIPKTPKNISFLKCTSYPLKPNVPQNPNYFAMHLDTYKHKTEKRDEQIA
jgi:hypothetical protein